VGRSGARRVAGMHAESIPSRSAIAHLTIRRDVSEPLEVGGELLVLDGGEVDGEARVTGELGEADRGVPVDDPVSPHDRPDAAARGCSHARWHEVRTTSVPDPRALGTC